MARRQPQKPIGVRSQIGRFAVVPMWLPRRLRELKVTSAALDLYVWLAGEYANHATLVAWPSNDTLADVMGVSVPSVRRAVTDLRRAGGIKTRRRHRADGSVMGLEYVVVQVEPDAAEHQTLTGDRQGGPERDLEDGPGHVIGGDQKGEAPESAGSQGVLPIAGDQEGGHQIITGDRQADGQMITGDETPRSPVITAYKEEPDPSNQKELVVVPAPQSPASDGGDEQIVGFVAVWNETVTAPLQPVAGLSAKRRSLIRARLVDHPLDVWRRIVSRLNASQWCRGQNRDSFVAHFDWVIATADVGLKALEGGFNNRPRRLAVGSLTPALSSGDVWSHVLSAVSGKISRHEFHTWFLHDTALLADHGQELEIGAPGIHIEWISKHHAQPLAEALESVRPGLSLTWVVRPARRHA